MTQTIQARPRESQPWRALIAARLTRQEAAELVGIKVGTINKAIEQGIFPVQKAGPKTDISYADLTFLVLMDSARIRLPKPHKVAIRRWLQKVLLDGPPTPSLEFSLSPALVLRYTPEVENRTKKAERYLQLRDEYIINDEDIFGGEPIIKGTRLKVHSIAHRLDDGDTVEMLQEGYPDIPLEVFKVAQLYAKANPRRGRPVRPWERSGSRSKQATQPRRQKTSNAEYAHS